MKMHLMCNDRAAILATECNQDRALRVLLTGFEPFGGATRNPSADAVRLLGMRGVAGVALRVAILPTSFAGAGAALEAALAETATDVVLSVGLAGGRAGLSVERVAINLDDARIADNAGEQPIDRRVVEGGPDAYFSTLPVKAMVAAIRTAGIEASVSYSAGTFVCNHVLYKALHMATRQPGLRCGFVHIPWLPGDGSPSLETALVVAGLDAALGCLRDAVAEPEVAEGTLS